MMLMHVLAVFTANSHLSYVVGWCSICMHGKVELDMPLSFMGSDICGPSRIKYFGPNEGSFRFRDGH